MTRLSTLRISLLVFPLLLATGCSIIGGPSEPRTVYAPQPTIHADPAWPSATAWSLTIADPLVPQMADNQRIVVSPTAGELQYYRAAQWAQTPGAMLSEVVLRTLERSGKVPVARQASGIGADYRLQLEIRAFRSDYAGGATPEALIEVQANLLHLPDQALAGSHTFKVTHAAAGVGTAQVADAFTVALGDIGHDIAGWTLQSGNTHQQTAHP